MIAGAQDICTVSKNNWMKMSPSEQCGQLCLSLKNVESIRLNKASVVFSRYSGIEMQGCSGSNDDSRNSDESGRGRKRVKLMTWKDLPSAKFVTIPHSGGPHLLSTGFHSMDLVCGFSGTPDPAARNSRNSMGFPATGCIIELLGQTSGVGKTFIALHTIASVALTYCTDSSDNKAKRKVLYIDTSNTMTTNTTSQQMLMKIVTNTVQQYLTVEATTAVALNQAQPSEPSGATPLVINSVSYENPAAASAALVQECLRAIDIVHCYTLQELIELLYTLVPKPLSASEAVSPAGICSRPNQPAHDDGSCRSSCGDYYGFLVIDSLYPLLAPLHSNSNSYNNNAVISSTGTTKTAVSVEAPPSDPLIAPAAVSNAPISSSSSSSAGTVTTATRVGNKEAFYAHISTLGLLLRRIAVSGEGHSSKSSGSGGGSGRGASIMITNTLYENSRGQQLHRADSSVVGSATNYLSRSNTSFYGNAGGTANMASGNPYANYLLSFKRFGLDQQIVSAGPSTTVAAAASSNSGSSAPAAGVGGAGGGAGGASAHIWQEVVNISLLIDATGVVPSDSMNSSSSGSGTSMAQKRIHIEVLARPKPPPAPAGMQTPPPPPTQCDIIIQ